MKTSQQVSQFWDLIERTQSREFKWGSYDCGIFAIEVVEIFKGAELAENIRRALGNWNSERQAYKKYISGSLLLTTAVFLGEPGAKNFLGLGDIAIAESGGAQGLCSHDGVNFIGPAPSLIGLQKIPSQNILSGWRL